MIADRNRLFRVLAWLALLPVLLVVYYPALHAPFLLDDGAGIVGNSEFRSFSLKNLTMLVRGHADARTYDHHAIPGLVSMIDHAWAGVDPFGYHLTNLAIHWANCGLILLLFLAVWREVKADEGGRALWMGVCAMAIWAVHPFSTMPVGYITCRTESLMVMFYVLSLLAFLRGWEWASVPLGVASILSKEVAVTLPGAILMVDWARGGVGIVPTLLRRWRYYTGLTIVWLVMIVYHLRGGRSQQIGSEGQVLAPIWVYFKVECGVIAGYASKLFWPAKLQFYPFYRPAAEWWQWMPQLAGLVAYFGVALYCLRRSRWVGVILLFPLLVLLPTSSFIPIPMEPAMEYRMYLPSAALIGLMVVGLWRLASPKWVPIAVVVAVAIPLAVVSHLRSRDYETSVKLHEQQVSVDPKSLTGLEALAGGYSTMGFLDRASATAWKLVDYSLEDNNKEFAGRGFNILGNIENERGNYPAARDYFKRATDIAGSNAAWLSLANVQVRLYELKDAEVTLNRLLATTPDHPEAMLLLYESKMSAKNYEEAERILDKFLLLYPDRREELDVQKTRLMHMKRKQAEGGDPLVKERPRP